MLQQFQNIENNYIKQIKTYDKIIKELISKYDLISKQLYLGFIQEHCSSNLTDNYLNVLNNYINFDWKYIQEVKSWDERDSKFNFDCEMKLTLNLDEFLKNKIVQDKWETEGEAQNIYQRIKDLDNVQQTLNKIVFDYTIDDFKNYFDNGLDQDLDKLNSIADQLDIDQLLDVYKIIVKYKQELLQNNLKDKDQIEYLESQINELENIE